MQKWAIVSVYEKEGVEEIAKALEASGYSILSTGGTARYLQEHGVRIHSVSEYTGHPEILDGRVKSLHPKIHGGILARRNQRKDLEELAAQSIHPIDVVVINLYPFSEQAAARAAEGSTESLVELIDIGGPTMIRAAAKNCEFVLPVSDPKDYAGVAELIRAGKEIAIEKRRALAAKVFMMMSQYDAAIASYFSENELVINEEKQPILFPEKRGLGLEKQMSLRYGENPHQEAALYRDASASGSSYWEKLQGKELSYNNLLDMYGTLDLFLEFYASRSAEQAAVIIKHSNPCGAAQRASSKDAFEAARACDPVSAFGGIVAVSGKVDAGLAESMLEGFIEVLLVEEMDAGAAALFSKKKNLRVLRCDFEGMAARRARGSLSMRSYLDDVLVQTADTAMIDASEMSHAAGATLDAAQRKEAAFAWKVAKHVKSNAIVIVKDCTAIGVGAGQMSRVDSARLAVQRARAHGHDLTQTVAASDAFLPFPDTLEILAEAGVSVLVQPGGSIKDEEVVAAAERLGVSMVLTGMRHFRH